MGRSRAVKSCGPCTNKDPGKSSSKERLESVPPEGLGFLDNVHQSRVSRS